MSEENRQFSRTDRPGSGIYRQEPRGIAFDDYRSADQRQLHHPQGPQGWWARLTGFFKAGLFPLKFREESLAEEAQSALAEDPTLESSHVRISGINGSLLATGSVPTRWMKARITRLLSEASGGGSVINELEIHPDRNPLPQTGSLSPKTPKAAGE